MTQITTGIQVMGLVDYAGILIVAAVIWRRWPEARTLITFPALWAGFGAVYYGFVLAGRMTPEALLLWGAVHRLLAGFMVLSGMVALLLILKTQPESDGTD